MVLQLKGQEGEGEEGLLGRILSLEIPILSWLPSLAF